MFDEAYAIQTRQFGGDPELTSALERGYAEGGYPGAEKRLADVLATRFGEARWRRGRPHGEPLRARRRPGPCARLAREAYAERDPNMPYIGRSPILDPLRAEPRFQALLRQMNLPQ